ncbi:MAG: hypothetical protein M1838_001597 [Thelocarpon superellum]|nr:MAG: hypothetical protein M1838_001597 [Thelocarpon superellum]
MVLDPRAPAGPRLQYIESHNDDVTEVGLAKSLSGLALLTGMSVNIFDMNLSEEDDALQQVLNHGSSIHQAGFLNDTDVFALSHDEVFSLYTLGGEDEAANDATPKQFGDLRERLNCEYVVEVIPAGAGEAMVVGGNHSQDRVDFHVLQKSPEWSLNTNPTTRLRAGHRNEIVRSVYVDDQTQRVYSAGEDGRIQAWKPKPTLGALPREALQKADQPMKQRKEKAKDGRYQPY